LILNRDSCIITKIKCYDPNFKPDFEGLIKLIKKITGKSPKALGSETSFPLVAKIFYGGKLPSDEALKLSKAYGVKIDALRNYLKREKDGITRLSFREAKLPSKPEEVSKDNLYQQLLFLERVASQSGVSAVKTILQRYENFKPSEIERIVDLLLKSYAIKQNKGVKLSSKEKEEMEILKGMQDVLKGKFVKIGETTLEDFI
jgi:hypothetical protein